MAAPCYESQAKDKIKVPPAVAKAFANEILDEMRGFKKYPEMDPGAQQGVPKSYKEALDTVAERSGLKADTVNHILRKDPQVFSRTKQALAKASDVRAIRNAAEAFAGDLKSNAAMYEPGNIAKAWDLQRKIALGGHSVVFPWSHMRNWAVQIPTEAGRTRMSAFWRAATDVYRYGGEKGKALYEMDVSLMQMGDRYDFWKQSGADIVPGKRDPGDILLKGKKSTWGARNFDTLKIARYHALEDIWSRTDPALREGEVGKAYASIVAYDLNGSTGSVTRPMGDAALSASRKLISESSAFAGKSNTLLSSKLFFAKHLDATFGPLRYLSKAGRMTEAERAASHVALKRWANTATAHLSILGANWAFCKAMGWETPNLTDPTKSDFMRGKIKGVVVPFSPLLEAVRLPIVAIAAFAAGKPKEGGSRLFMAAWNAAHPAAHTIYEQVSGRDYIGRPLKWTLRNALAKVFPKTAPKFSEANKEREVGGLEYAATKAPIAIAGGLHEFYQSLRDQGVGASMAMAVIKGALATVASGVTGMHAYEEHVKKEKSDTQKEIEKALKGEGKREKSVSEQIEAALKED